MVMIEFHMIEDSIHLDIDSRNYNCITVWHVFSEGEMRIFHVFGILGCCKNNFL